MVLLSICYIVSPAVRQRRATEASAVVPSHSAPPDEHIHKETYSATNNQGKHRKTEKAQDGGQRKSHIKMIWE